jgi:hypothetical protein
MTPTPTPTLRPDGGKGREGMGGRGEERARCAARGLSQSPAAGRCPPITGAIVTCVIPDILLKHPDETFATYVCRLMKHLKHVSKTLTKTSHEKLLQNICNIQIKHLQHMCKTYVTSK